MNNPQTQHTADHATSFVDANANGPKLTREHFRRIVQNRTKEENRAFAEDRKRRNRGKDRDRETVTEQIMVKYFNKYILPRKGNELEDASTKWEQAHGSPYPMDRNLPQLPNVQDNLYKFIGMFEQWTWNREYQNRVNDDLLCRLKTEVKYLRQRLSTAHAPSSSSTMEEGFGNLSLSPATHETHAYDLEDRNVDPYDHAEDPYGPAKEPDGLESRVLTESPIATGKSAPKNDGANTPTEVDLSHSDEEGNEADEEVLSENDRSLARFDNGKWLDDDCVVVVQNTFPCRSKDLVLLDSQMTKKECCTPEKLTRVFQRRKQPLRRSMRLVLPLNIQNTHWVVVLYDLDTGKRYVMDSMAPSDLKGAEPFEIALLEKCDWIDWWTTVRVSVPQQPNSYDCGIFSLKFIEALCGLESNGAITSELFQGISTDPTHLCEYRRTFRKVWIEAKAKRKSDTLAKTTETRPRGRPRGTKVKKKRALSALDSDFKDKFKKPRARSRSRSLTRRQKKIKSNQ